MELSISVKRKQRSWTGKQYRLSSKGDVDEKRLMEKN